MVEKVISGGQIGADIAGLRAAKKLGISTGGYAPKGWQTTRGPAKELLQSFGLVEHTTAGYPQRTRMNVRHSDCTVRFAFNWQSGGERCTMREIIRYSKPFYDVHIHFPEGYDTSIELTPSPKFVADFLLRYEVKILNVAGNAAHRIEDSVEQFMLVVLTITNKGGE